TSIRRPQHILRLPTAHRPKRWQPRRSSPLYDVYFSNEREPMERDCPRVQRLAPVSRGDPACAAAAVPPAARVAPRAPEAQMPAASSRQKTLSRSIGPPSLGIRGQIDNLSRVY